jgi:hypothetical protein
MSTTQQHIDDGGPAFPFGQISELTGQPINGFFEPGMSLRDWLAGMALQGLSTHGASLQTVATQSVKLADLVLAELKKGGKP